MSVVLTHLRFVCSAADLKLECYWWSFGLMDTSLAFICRYAGCLASGSLVQDGSCKEDRLWRTLREDRCAGQRRCAFCIIVILFLSIESFFSPSCVMAIRLRTSLHSFQWWPVFICPSTICLNYQSLTPQLPTSPFSTVCYIFSSLFDPVLITITTCPPLSPFTRHRITYTLLRSPSWPASKVVPFSRQELLF